MKNAIEVKNVKKAFRKPTEKTIKGQMISLFKREKTVDKFQALEDVSFEVKKGEGYAIIGKNGAGKSTLFKVISGVIVPDSGSIQLNGTLMPLIELSAGLSGDLSGVENIRLNCAIYGLKKADIEKLLPIIIDFAELDEFINTPVKFYSSGMKARLGFSIAVHIDTDIVLIDEVLAVGDKDFREKCNKKMLEMKEKGKTIVIVSHSMGPLRKICDRAIVLKRGKVEAQGNILDMIKLYESK
ncbi:ABC transporter ATP-binding protein [Alkalicoccobacillus murimartini]|uniref:ABC-type polysaccharide/polyol phosphate transport system ATPase subunit n=1 Tax=Alkalicoccobacillus murimartini TaxID=171685 RepID=A0ABT9YG21_9BACI|nr:ABC transporter ATP-binding protein [Alkalicoccobacillus murimartini]MDQ0206809.1 ABC-type polysaccharide/polyol phosphate transport system ATPase subunit [Alkalicoccobacillus murimartini]